MAAVKSFKIKIADNRTSFHPGDLVRGHVHLRLNNVLRLNRVTMTFIGEAHTRWSDCVSASTGNPDNCLQSNHVCSRKVKTSEVKDMFNHEVYVNKCVRIDGGKMTPLNPWIILKRGKHNMDFKFEIPKRSPASFVDEEHGHVKYFLKCCIDCSEVIERTKEIQMLGLCDLNTLFCLDTTIVVHHKSRIQTHCLCTRSIDVKFYADRIIYIPGDIVKCKAQITNRTKQKLNNVYVKLLRTVTFHFDGEFSRRTITLVTVSRHSKGLDIGLTDIGWTLEVPPTPPSSLFECIMYIEYMLELNITTESMKGETIGVPLQVVIGTNPHSPGRSHSTKMSPTVSKDVSQEIIRNSQQHLIVTTGSTCVDVYGDDVSNIPGTLHTLKGESVDEFLRDAKDSVTDDKGKFPKILQFVDSLGMGPNKKAPSLQRQDSSHESTGKWYRCLPFLFHSNATNTSVGSSVATRTTRSRHSIGGHGTLGWKAIASRFIRRAATQTPGMPSVLQTRRPEEQLSVISSQLP